VKVGVVGCGHVGLVTAVGFAMSGHRVTGVDLSATIVELINAGRAPFYEAGLEKAIADVLRRGTFYATMQVEAVRDADVILICVGTPSQNDGSVDLTLVHRAVDDVARLLSHGSHYQVLTIRSTVVPGTTEAVVMPVVNRLRATRTTEIGVAVNPEFLREGEALSDFLTPDRIVVGELDKRSGDVMAELYKPFLTTLIRTNIRTAELTKYAMNALLATLISFSNEIADICEQLNDVDVQNVMAGVHADRRLSHTVNGQRVRAGIIEYLKPGCGFGGSCLPKDLRALIAFSRCLGLRPILLEAAHSVNVTRGEHLVDLGESWVGNIEGKTALVLGLSFKAGTNDIRESPGIVVAAELLRRGASVLLADPLVTRNQVIDLLEAGAEFVDDPPGAVNRADLCFITTAAPEFRFLERSIPAEVERVSRPVVIDGRRLLDTAAISQQAPYLGIGSGRFRSIRRDRG